MILRPIDIFNMSKLSIEPSGGASGQASDIAIHAKEILRWRTRLTEIYVRHCTKDSPTPSTSISGPAPTEKAKGKAKAATGASGEKETVEQASQRFEAALERDYFMTGTLYLVQS